MWTRSLKFEDIGKQKITFFDDSGLISASINLACSKKLRATFQLDITRND